MAMHIHLCCQSTDTLWYCCQFTEEKTEAQRGYMSCPEATEIGPLNLLILIDIRKKKKVTRTLRCGVV